MAFCAIVPALFKTFQKATDVKRSSQKTLFIPKFVTDAINNYN